MYDFDIDGTTWVHFTSRVIQPWQSCEAFGVLAPDAMRVAHAVNATGATLDSDCTNEVGRESLDSFETFVPGNQK
jgi:hypothetical protein